MPVIYRVKHDGDDERTCTFFAKKGEASKFRRANKKEKNTDDVETFKISGRDTLCQLLNDPYGFEEELDLGEF